MLARLANLPGALPGACAQGLIWGSMAIGVYLTNRILDVADLTVDGSFGTGGAVCVMCLLSGQNLPVSAAGGGRRRCPKGGASGVPVRHLSTEKKLFIFINYSAPLLRTASAGLCRRARPFAPYRASGIQ